LRAAQMAEANLLFLFTSFIIRQCQASVGTII
jgi:hypothetical protein